MGSASSAGTPQRDDSMAVCGIGAWASAIHAVVRVLEGESLLLVSAPGCPLLWEVVLHGSRQQLQVGQRRSIATCLDERYGAAGRQFLASAFQLPLLLLEDQSLMPQGAIQRRVCGWVAGEQVRRGWLENPG